MWFRSDTRGTLLPITDGTHFAEVSPSFRQYDIHVRFLNEAGEIVTPTGGTVTIRAGLLDGQFLEPSAGDGVINAAEAGAEAEYDVVRFSGAVRYVRAVVEGITGSDVFSLQIFIAGV